MKKIALYFILIFAVAVAHAQVSFELRAPNAVAQGERFRIEFVLTNAKAQRFTPPTITGVDVLAGPITSTGTNIEIVNGNRKDYSTVTYTYTVQALDDAKKIAIGASSVTTEDGKNYSTKASQIDVLAAQNQGNAQQRRQSGTVDKDAVQLRMSVNKSSVYKGEAVVATLRLYTQVGISGFESVKMPAFNGFWKQELTMDNQRPTRENLDGKLYESQVVSQWLIYPQRTGTLEIEQTDVTALVQVVTQASGSSMFDMFFDSGRVETVKRKLTTAPVKITVKDLPAPQPLGFSGAVGKFTMSASITTNEISANSGGSINVELKGVGDFPLIDNPVIEFPNGFEKYEIKQSEQITNSAGGTSGTRKWEFPFIARAEGDYTIPAVEFVYFDPSTGKYNTIKSDEFSVKVLRDNSAGANSAAIVSGVTKEDLKMLGEDVRFIYTGKPNFTKKDNFFLWSVTFFIAFALIILVFFGMLVLLKQQIKNRSDVARTKTKKANSTAIRRLKKAKSYMTVGANEKFFEEMLRALWGYMGDKLTIQVSDLSKERLRDEFERRGVNGEQGEEFLSLIGECELAQYSPAGSVDMSKVYEEALDLIGKLEIRKS
ncbi:BatD [Mucinivorans hirudinis]|uniref:BatD n=1 Tax=Mucinivorans hirudinis TaxID=1433126 RepID=A0A060R5X7_9BACT|nr:BatD [Mucinivorans hirudinis]